ATLGWLGARPVPRARRRLARVAFGPRVSGGRGRLGGGNGAPVAALATVPGRRCRADGARGAGGGGARGGDRLDRGLAVGVGGAWAQEGRALGGRGGGEPRSAGA